MTAVDRVQSLLSALASSEGEEARCLVHSQLETAVCEYVATQWAKFRSGDDQPATEVPLFDRTRVDLLTLERAYEADWAPKWKEAIGQSLFYAIMTGRQPGILLLVEKQAEDLLHLHRCHLVCRAHGIELLIYLLESQTLLHDGQTYHLR